MLLKLIRLLRRFVREFKGLEGAEVGAEITVDTFAAGDVVDVTGTSKGKGFQGPIKRHGQSRGPMAHGSRYHRRPVQWVLLQLTKFQKVKNLLDVWVTNALLYKTLLSHKCFLKRTLSL